VLQEIDERYADSTYELVWSTVLSDCVASVAGAKNRTESSVTLAKAMAVQNPDVRQALEAKNASYARRKVFQMMAGNLERDTFIVSRELTRRVGRHDREARVDRWRP
jgi:hypothetical protein